MEQMEENYDQGQGGSALRQMCFCLGVEDVAKGF
jgi:hypothetical protein